MSCSRSYYDSEHKRFQPRLDQVYFPHDGDRFSSPNNPGEKPEKRIVLGSRVSAYPLDHSLK